MIEKVLKDDMCLGCGICESIYGKENIEIELKNNRFARPRIKKEIETDIFNKVCPAVNVIFDSNYSKSIWGNYAHIYLGWSLNHDIRYRASSGGVITQILLYLLKNKTVDAIIHIGASKNDPLTNEVYLSTSVEDVLHNTGSRYSPASPLINIDNVLALDKTFAFVGKPCDIRALKNYSLINPKVNEKIKYTLSFFCAGTPSYQSTLKILEKLDVKKNEVYKFSYRGNGWPGRATVEKKFGESKSMSYDESWGKILGRDVQKGCRFCLDGTGEIADIACGDAWYGDEKGFPIFIEQDGRNIIFTRTQKGDDLIQRLAKDEKLYIENFDKKVHLIKNMQPYQYDRKSTMFYKIIALKLFRKYVPNYDIKYLTLYSKNTPFKRKIRVFLGTCKRILQGKI